MTAANPRTYIYGIIITMFFIVGGVSLLGIFNTYNEFDTADRTGEFNRTFNKLNEISSQIESMEEGIDSDPDWGLFGALNALIQSGWTSLTLLFTSLAFMDDFIGGMAAFFGVPAWIPTIILLFITVTIIFSIYKMIFQTE